MPQGFVLTLDSSAKPFNANPLARIIRPNAGLKYLQIYHSVTGGQDNSAEDRRNNLRVLQYQTDDMKRILFDVENLVPELRYHTGKWKIVAEDMLTSVTEARQILSSSSNWLQLRRLVGKLDNELNIMTRAFDLLVAQLETYRNRTNVLTVIDRLVRLRGDIPKTISLLFSKVSVHQNFLGLRFQLVAEICHKRLCFSNIKSIVWSLQGDQCRTNIQREVAGLLVEGTALQSINLNSFMAIPAGGTVTVFLTRDRNQIATTFQSHVNVLGIKKNVTVSMNERELSFDVWGNIFGGLDALLIVNAQIENVENWNSILLAVEGKMNRSSRLHTLLQNKIVNDSKILAKEATQRLANAQVAFHAAQKKLSSAKEVFKLKESTVEDLRIEKEKADNARREALLRYDLNKVRFNNTLNRFHHLESAVCEIKDCNYTCLVNGCAVPDLCQDLQNITFIETQCDIVEKVVMVEKVEASEERRSFQVPTYKVIYTGDCKSDFYSVGEQIAGQIGGAVGSAVGTSIGGAIGGPIGGLIGGAIGGVIGGAIGSALFGGCDDTYETVNGEPRTVEYYEKVFETKLVDTVVEKVECSRQTERTKPGGYGPPYRCCKQRGCETKLLDPQCISTNNECEHSLNQLKFILDLRNRSLLREFLLLRNAANEMKITTFSYEKARLRYEKAITLLKQVEAHINQQSSAVEITNASLVRVRRIVDLGLKIAEALNASDGKEVVDLEELKFSLFVPSEGIRKISFQSNARTVSGKRATIRFLVDFDQVERSITSASKSITANLFSGGNSRRKRSIAEVISENSTNSVYSSFTDYQYACLFMNKTHQYFKNMFDSLGDLITSVKGLNFNLSSGLRELEILTQTVVNSSLSQNVSLDASSGDYSNNSFVGEYVEMVQVLKDGIIGLNNDSSQNWNDTLEAWRAFLEVFTSAKEFEECSGTQDCIEYFFAGAKEFYEFEDSPRALEIKEALPQLKEVIKSLTTEDMSMQEAEQALTRAALFLNLTYDDSVLCGGLPRITSSSQGEVIIFPGDNLTLNCRAKEEQKLKYAWRRNDNIIGETVDGTFHVGNVTTENEGAYYCIVSNNRGSTVSNVTLVKVQTKPVITDHPKPQRVVFRSQMPVTFTCNATANPLPTFEWFFQPRNSLAIKVNETRPVLYIANPDLHQEGYYYCNASNAHGIAVTQIARLDVLNYTVGLPRLLVAFNLTTRCWNSSSISSNSSAPNPLPCDSESINIEPSSLDRNLSLTRILLQSLATSLNVSKELIPQLEYFSRNDSRLSVIFILNVVNKPWKQDNLKLYVDIVEAIAVAKANMFKKLQQFNTEAINKTFTVPWNTSSLVGEPGSVHVYSLPPECPERQYLSGNGFICGKFPVFLQLYLT